MYSCIINNNSYNFNEVKLEISNNEIKILLFSKNGWVIQNRPQKAMITVYDKDKKLIIQTEKEYSLLKETYIFDETLANNKETFIIVYKEEKDD